MNAIRQYRPTFFDGPEPERAEFDSAESLLAVPFVASFGQYPDFRQFRVSDEWLVAEYADGARMIVGRLDDPKSVSLPPN